MKNKLYLLVVILILMCVGIWNAYGQKSPGRQAWEYKSVVIARSAQSKAEFSLWVEASPEGTKQLTGRVYMPLKAQELGEQGWELVSVTPVSNTTTQDTAGFTDNIIYWFKRPR
jgi:hypothetical protein